jgi:hypothetical protein
LGKKLMVAAATIGSAVVGGVVSSKASSKARKAAQKAQTTNNALEERVRTQNQAALQPYIDAGIKPTGAIQALLGLGGEDAMESQNAAFETFRNSAGYQDQFNEGVRSLQAGFGSKGLLDSGAAQKAAIKYGQSQANRSFGDYYSRLVGQQQVGASGAGALAGVNQAFVNGVTNNNNNAADATGNAALSNAANINSVIGAGLSAYGYSKGMGTTYGKPGGG